MREYGNDKDAEDEGYLPYASEVKDSSPGKGAGIIANNSKQLEEASAQVKHQMASSGLSFPEGGSGSMPVRTESAQDENH